MKKSAAFSLIEVLIFISILSVFFVVAMVIVTASLRNMKINEHKILATRYAEELSEWITSQKENNWNTFTTRISATPYCFKTLDATWPAGACSSADKIDSLFTRQAAITGDATQVSVNITVSWSEPGGTYNVPVNKVYRIWE